MKLEHKLTLALTKGRILRETLPLLAEVGIAPREDLDSSRKLIEVRRADAVVDVQSVGIGADDRHACAGIRERLR